MLDKPVLEVIKDNYGKIFSAEKKVADFVLEHPQEAVDANVSELAKASGVSGLCACAIIWDIKDIISSG